MRSYFIRRFLLIIPTFLGITLMVFAITRIVPGGPIERMIAQAQDQAGAGFERRLADKRARRAADEAAKPLAAYRSEELERMRLNFFGFDPSYHVARYNFVRKVPKSRTPLYLARHRVRRPPGENAPG